MRKDLGWQHSGQDQHHDTPNKEVEFWAVEKEESDGLWYLESCWSVSIDILSSELCSASHGAADLHYCIYDDSFPLTSDCFWSKVA